MVDSKRMMYHSTDLSSKLDHLCFDPHRLHEAPELEFKKSYVNSGLTSEVLFGMYIGNQVYNYLRSMDTVNRVQKPRTTNNSCNNPGTFSLLFSLSRISNTQTYSKVPAAIA